MSNSAIKNFQFAKVMKEVEEGRLFYDEGEMCTDDIEPRDKIYTFRIANKHTTTNVSQYLNDNQTDYYQNCFVTIDNRVSSLNLNRLLDAYNKVLAASCKIFESDLECSGKSMKG